MLWRRKKMIAAARGMCATNRTCLNDATRAASDLADTVYRVTDQLAAIRHQHDLVILCHWKCCHDLASLSYIDIYHTLTAALRHTIVMR